MRHSAGLGVLLLTFVAATPSAPARTDEAARPPGLRDLHIHLNSKNGSNEVGTAMLYPVGGQTRVVIFVTGEPAGATQPANVQAGDCGRVELIRYELQYVRNGRSASLVNVPFGRLNAAHLVVNIQESEASLHAPKDARDVSCGAIP